jgi:predicted DNA-binding transcriptional regulator YafY
MIRKGDQMQVNRLFETIYILLNKKTITAKELSDKFEVSVRTIYRDIETLSAAGIPVYMSKGKGGGIRLLDHFTLSKSVLSTMEQNEILAALQGLHAIKYPDVDHLISKLGAIFNKSDCNWVDVDFSHWGSHDKEKFNLLKTAILNRKVVSFDYFGSNGQKANRSIEPFQLWFKNKSWYLKGYCLSKQAVRLFKVTRIKNLQLTEMTFDRVLPVEELQEAGGNDQYKIVELQLQLQASIAHRVYDEFDENNIIQNEDGSFTVKVCYPEDEWIYGYILSFGSAAKVIEPTNIRDIVIERLKQTLEHYN